jgi:hypothetical protein
MVDGYIISDGSMVIYGKKIKNFINLKDVIQAAIDDVKILVGSWFIRFKNMRGQELVI